MGDASVKLTQSVAEYAELVETSDELRPIANNVKKFHAALDQGLKGYHELGHSQQDQEASIEETSASLEEMTARTQQNAAHAQESAGASEELNAQAERMKSTIDELAALIGDTGSHETDEEISDSLADDDIHSDLALPEPLEDETRAAAKEDDKINPEQVIPLSESDLKRLS